ncbi:Protein of unknown function DUF3143 [Dillenia turbinata]|uniref:Uncharacterized protein n=1 Tax=Dillenia turbinata TaxID=194707 RepID=A0AAN8Z5S5_9MAGN
MWMCETELSSTEDEWLGRLPDKKKPLYSHSLPCAEAWLKNLGFCQSKDDRTVWFIKKPDWHAQLSLDVTDVFIRPVLHLSGIKISSTGFYSSAGLALSLVSEYAV